MDDTFSHVGILFIDEKSMVGQETFTMVRKRLQEARPHYKDKPFGNRSVVILGGLPAAVTSLRACQMAVMESSTTSYI